MRIALTYGGIAGAVLVGFFVISFYVVQGGQEVDYDLGEKIGYSSMVLSLLAVFFGIRRQRDDGGGKLSLWQGFKTGAGISAVAGAIFGVFTSLLYGWLDPSLEDKLMVAYEAKLVEDGLSAAEIVARMAEWEAMQAGFFGTTLGQGVLMFITEFALGLVIALISAAILRRQ